MNLYMILSFLCIYIFEFNCLTKLINADKVPSANILLPERKIQQPRRDLFKNVENKDKILIDAW